MRWLPRGFPCLGFTRLNGRGVPAACDGDADCVLTMLMMQYAFNRAGFLGNAAGVDMSGTPSTSPLFRPLKMEGPTARRRLSVAPARRTPRRRRPRSPLSPRQKLTFTKMVHLDSLLVFTGKIIEVPMCRRNRARLPDGTGRRSQRRDEAVVQLGRRCAGRQQQGLLRLLAPRGYYGDHTRTCGTWRT